jgi:hypothetical protein
MRNVSDKSGRQNQNILYEYSTPFSENCDVYETMWNNMVEPDSSQMTIRRKLIACSITKGTNTHSQYVILIVFPLQQWLHERASLLRLYVHCMSSLTLQLFFV